jgi:hypothetical protein
MNFIATLEQRSERFWLACSLLLVLLLGVIDYATGPEIAFSAFYLIPVSATAWFVGRRPAFVISVCDLGVIRAKLAPGRYRRESSVFPALDPLLEHGLAAGGVPVDGSIADGFEDGLDPCARVIAA